MSADDDQGVVLRLDFVDEKIDRSFVSRRVWSKGSARGAGPQKGQGNVRRRLFEHPAFERCRCGAAMRRCDDCGAFWCAAPGHPRHQCIASSARI